MVEPLLLALGLVLGLVILLPARRLQDAGFSTRTIAVYALALWLGAMVMALRPVGARVLVPILLVAYLAPFVTAPDRVRRIVTRGRDGVRAGVRSGAPPMKNVTPPEDEDRPQ